jgi:hypothetical protein
LRDSNPTPPHLIISVLPKEHQERAWTISSSLSSLLTYVGQVEAALELLKFASSQIHDVSTQISEVMSRAQSAGEPFRGFDDIRQLGTTRSTLSEWTLIAGRDAAMTVYHFAETIEATKLLLHECPPLKAMVDWKEIRKAQKRFSAAFPQYEMIRHAVAHDGELADSPKAFKKNSHSGEYQKGGLSIDEGSTNIRFTGSLGGELAVTIKGSILTFALNDYTLEKLRDALVDFYNCFRNAESKTKDMLYSQATARQKKASEPPPAD